MIPIAIIAAVQLSCLNEQTASPIARHPALFGDSLERPPKTVAIADLSTLIGVTYQSCPPRLECLGGSVARAPGQPRGSDASYIFSHARAGPDRLLVLSQVVGWIHEQMPEGGSSRSSIISSRSPINRIVDVVRLPRITFDLEAVHTRCVAGAETAVFAVIGKVRSGRDGYSDRLRAESAAPIFYAWGIDWPSAKLIELPASSVRCGVADYYER
jgi:hypothetical protein